jgi:hypothetical protein
MLNGPVVVPPGLIETIEGAGHSVTRTPAGWTSSNDAAVQSIIDGYDTSAERLAFHKDRRREELDAAFVAKIDAGLLYQNVVFQIDDSSRANIAAMATFAISAINLGGAWPEGFYWIAADNSHIAMAAQEMLAFAQSAGTYVSALVLARRALKDAVAAAATVEEVEAIDLVNSWSG